LQSERFEYPDVTTVGLRNMTGVVDGNNLNAALKTPPRAASVRLAKDIHGRGDGRIAESSRVAMPSRAAHCLTMPISVSGSNGFVTCA